MANLIPPSKNHCWQVYNLDLGCHLSHGLKGEEFHTHVQAELHIKEGWPKHPRNSVQIILDLRQGGLFAQGHGSMPRIRRVSTSLRTSSSTWLLQAQLWLHGRLAGRGLQHLGYLKSYETHSDRLCHVGLSSFDHKMLPRKAMVGDPSSQSSHSEFPG